MPNTTAEYRLLEVAIYDLKTKNNELQKALDAVIEDRDSYHEENNELRKDKERMDWIFKHCDVGYDRFYKTSFDNRKEIDQAMEDYGVPNSE